MNRIGDRATWPWLRCLRSFHSRKGLGLIDARPFGFDRDEIERRKQLIRDLWAGKPVDHIPIHLMVMPERSPYTMREQQQDGDKQLDAAFLTAGLSWRCIPESDYIPAMRPDVGCSCLATAFGAELYWSGDPNQTCGVKEPVLRDVNEAYALPVPLPDDGDLAEGIRRVRRFAEVGEGLVSVSLLDMAGGLNVAMDLLGGNALNLAMYENPEALECLLQKIQDLFLATIALQIQAAGGEEFTATFDFPDYWFPEGRKGHVSDDISAMISPELYRRFSLPFHNQVFARYGAGGLHNCGPNPCLEQYLNHHPAPRAIDLSYKYSKCDLAPIKQVCRRRAIIYFGELPEGPNEALRTYAELMEFLAPDVIVIPAVAIREKDDPPEIYRRFRVISDEYARRIDWGWEDRTRPSTSHTS